MFSCSVTLENNSRTTEQQNSYLLIQASLKLLICRNSLSVVPQESTSHLIFLEFQSFSRFSLIQRQTPLLNDISSHYSTINKAKLYQKNGFEASSSHYLNSIVNYAQLYETSCVNKQHLSVQNACLNSILNIL